MPPSFTEMMLPHTAHVQHQFTEQGSPLIAPSVNRTPSPFFSDGSCNGSSPSTSRTSSPVHFARPSRFAPLSVRCEVRTRIPSEFGGVAHLHLYSNTRDSEEHLAIVYGDDITSQSLEEIRAGDTERERMLRGVKNISGVPNEENGVGQEQNTDSQGINGSQNGHTSQKLEKPPLCRIHSCCFTGETLRSLRCDCAEQLEEAMRLMSKEGRGVVLYLKQEGRGIGLREKMRAYNLIDLGHDTMAANLLLGHPPDARSYEIASAILRDLGIGRVRLLTNNPDKLSHLQRDGVEVAERVPMVPASWRRLGADVGVAVEKLKNGETAISDGVDQGSKSGTPELRLQDRDGYLVTKVQRMGHILDIPASLLEAVNAVASDSPHVNGDSS